MLECAWVADDEVCGEPAEVFSNIPLCPLHTERLRGRNNSLRGLHARQAARYHPLESFPGWCYVVLLPDGFVKIGYSNTDDLLKKRYQALKREYGAPVVELAKIPGGFVAEAVLHEKFRDYRESGTGERFRYSPEMADYLSSL